MTKADCIRAMNDRELATTFALAIADVLAKAANLYGIPFNEKEYLSEAPALMLPLLTETVEEQHGED